MLRRRGRAQTGCRAASAGTLRTSGPRARRSRRRQRRTRRGRRGTRWRARRAGGGGAGGAGERRGRASEELSGDWGSCPSSVFAHLRRPPPHAPPHSPAWRGAGWTRATRCGRGWFGGEGQTVEFFFIGEALPLCGEAPAARRPGPAAHRPHWEAHRLAQVPSGGAGPPPVAPPHASIHQRSLAETRGGRRFLPPPPSPLTEPPARGRGPQQRSGCDRGRA